MKKLLILMLVLGMASAANAALTWVDSAQADLAAIDLNLGDSAIVYIASDAALTYGIYAGDYLNTTANITAVTAAVDAGQDAAITPQIDALEGFWFLEALDFSPATLPNVAAGIHWAVTITASATELGTVELFSDFFAGQGVKDALTVNVIPEPMTIALLGLGGLFLLRRRK